MREKRVFQGIDENIIASVAEWIRRWILDQEVVGSTPGEADLFCHFQTADGVD